MNTCINFNMVYNTDYGLYFFLFKKNIKSIRFRGELYNFNLSLLTTHIDRLKCDKYRIDINPLCILSDNQNNIDLLYNHIIDKFYDDILKVSPRTNIYKLAKSMPGVYISCKFSKEQQLCKRDNLSILTDNDVDMDCYFYKYYSDYDENLLNKNIYLADIAINDISDDTIINFYGNNLKKINL